jgi:hypothetical protein
MGSEQSTPISYSGTNKGRYNQRQESDSDSSSDSDSYVNAPASAFPYVEVPVNQRKQRKKTAQDLLEHYSNTNEPWRQKFQPLYETRKDRARLGRMIGGSVTVTEAEKAKIDAVRKANKNR